jgi:uncharacterized membrane protein (UPF0127 family)
MDAATNTPRHGDSNHAWLVCAGRVLASAEVAVSRREKRHGLIGRTDFDGALVIPDCNWIHTIGVRFPLDVAYLDAEGVVLKKTSMSRFVVGTPVLRASTVVEAHRGSFDRWGLRVGDIVEVRTADVSGS